MGMEVLKISLKRNKIKTHKMNPAETKFQILKV